MVFLDKLGWPVERVKGRPVLNTLRLLIHTRKIVRKWEPPKFGQQGFFDVPESVLLREDGERK